MRDLQVHAEDKLKYHTRMDGCVHFWGTVQSGGMNDRIRLRHMSVESVCPLAGV